MWWWSYVLALGGACGFFMMRKGMWQGFAWSTVMQLVWVVYTITSQQWGFFFGVALYGPISLWGWLSWKKNTPAAARPRCTCPCTCEARQTTT